MSQSGSNHDYKSSDHVRILDGAPGAPDPKSLVYYDYFKGLTGSVVKAYADGTVAVSIDRPSLPPEILARHQQSELSQGNRWLNSLSEEERNRLSDKEKQFSLRYTLLVSAKQLVPEKAPAHSK